MDRRGFLQGLGCVITSIPGLGLTEVSSDPFRSGGPSKNTLAGIDCWIPDDFPDRRMATAQQAKFLGTKPHEVDLVRVTFADVNEAFWKRWQGAPHAARHFRPDLLLLNFNPARADLYPGLLDQALLHKRAGNTVLAIVREPGLAGRDVLRSHLTCRRLLQSGVPVLASLNDHDLASVLLDLVGSTHDQSFDWGDFQRMLRDGPIMAFARGRADSPASVVDAVESCVAQLKLAGLNRHQVRRALVTTYGAVDFDGFYAVADACRQLSECEGDIDLIVKWNQWLIQESSIELHVLAAGSAGELLAGRANV